MSSLTKNEIITLNHLADDEQHDDTPSGLSEAQFIVALKSLQARGMVFASFSSGGDVYACQIDIAGQAALDDLESAKKRILRKLLSDRNLTIDQYTLIKYTQEHGISSSSEMFAQEHFGVDCDYHKKNIWGPLTREDYLEVKEDHSGMIITRKGKQLLEEVEDELYELLANGGNANSVFSANSQTENTNMQDESAYATLLQAKENEIRELKKRFAESGKPITNEPHLNATLEAERWVELYGDKISHNFIDDTILVKKIDNLRNLYEDEVKNANKNGKKNWKTPFLRKYVCGPKVKWIKDGHVITHEMVKDLFGKDVFSADQVSDAKKLL